MDGMILSTTINKTTLLFPYRLWLLIWIHIYHCLSSGRADDILSFLGSEGKEYCMTNGTSAMYYTSQQGEIYEGTDFLPRSPYFCDFEDNNKCINDSNNDQGGYKIVNSLEYENLPIFDMRWEDLPVGELYSLGKSKRNRLSFTKISNVHNSENFKATLSVRATEVHFLLCDKEDVTSAKCYWFIIQGWNGRNTVLRKCKKQISDIAGEYPRKPCWNSLVNITHPDDYHTVLDQYKWSHFTLEKQGQILHLRYIENGKSETIIEYTDEADDFDVKYLLGHTKDSTAYYKLHKYRYLRTSQPSNDFIISKLAGMEVKNRKVCFSVMLTTCQNCWTTFSVVYLIRGKSKSIEFDVRPSYGIWTEQKFQMKNVEFLYYKVAIQTRLDPYSSDINLNSTFWGFDNFRQCHDKEYRVSKKGVKNLKKCFLIHPAKEAEWQNPEQSYVPEGECESWEQLGDSCIPCNLLKEDRKLYTCEKLRACEFTSNGSRCFCSPGYTGPNCDKVCEAGKYGYGCSQQCGNCYSGVECRKQDGNCNSCTDEFLTPKCLIPKRDIILKYPPSIVESSSSTCTVQLVNYEYLGALDFKYYLVQYQKAAAISTNVAKGENAWKDCGPIRRSDDVNPVIVEGLKSSAKYRMRILIASEENGIKRLNDAKVPFSICNTTCSEWHDSDIKLIPGNRTVTVVVTLSEEQCSLSHYNWTLQDEYGENLLADYMPVKNFSIGPLKIYMSYIIVFSGLNSIVKEFRTLESVPSEVHEVSQEESNIDTVKVRWKGPRYPNGIIDHYRIEYKKERGQHCIETKWGDTKEINISSEVIELKELYPFSVYIVTIYASNSKYESKGVSIEVKTAEDDEFSEEEGLDKGGLTLNKIYERSAIISVDKLNCQNLRGPLEISYNCKCESKWCKSTKVIAGTFSSSGSVAENDLQPYCDYSCTIFFCRKDKCTTPFQKEFQTKASYPNDITELLVTSKGENYVYLRWLPPYPPTGTLLKYRITYICKSCVSNHRIIEDFPPKNCSRWKNFHCAMLTQNIYIGHTHTINIEAANEENGNFRNVYRKFDVYVEESASQPPYNLKTRWHENNTLELLWYHPNMTNGNLKVFIIELTFTSVTTTFRYPVNEGKDTLLYHIKLEKHIPPSKEVYIKVFAINAHQSEPAIKRDSSFPVHPRLSNPNIAITNSTETTIRISLNTSLVNDDKNNAKYLFVLRSQLDSEKQDQNLLKLENILNKKIDNDTNLELIAEINLNNMTGTFFEFVVGQNGRTNQTAFLNAEIFNTPLQKAQYYNISILLVNDYEKKYTISIYSIRSFTLGDSRMTTEAPLTNDGGTEQPSEGNGGYYALLLLLLIPIILGAMFHCRKKYQSSSSISENEVMEAVFRSQPQSRSQSEYLLALEEPDSAYAVPNVIVKPKITRKLTNLSNEAEKTHSNPVKLSEFEEYVKQSIQSGELERQHSLFPRGQTQPWTVGSMKVNESKNHYNLIAYDHSRVKLGKIAGDEYSDYINASYVHGYNVPGAYIATQGPKSSTLLDFWRMIWQENVLHIITLANSIENGAKKFEQYWPNNLKEVLVFGNIYVEIVSVEINADFEYKIFHVTCENRMRKLEQFHFTSWPDKGVPLYPQNLVPFLRKIMKIPQSTSSPIVVHCSSGVGRTGMIILSEICLKMAAKEGVIDVMNNLQNLREQRVNMVDNVERYKLVHMLILESLMGLHTSIPVNNVEKVIFKLINEEEYKKQMDYLKSTEWQDEGIMSIAKSEEKFIIYPEKNRFLDIVPDKRSRISLTRYLSADSSTYINAVRVDGFRCPNRFIVTQLPMPNTLGDFWRLVVERRTSVIVSLNVTDARDKTCCQFYPTSDNPELRPTDFILIKFEKHVALDNYDIHSVRMFVTTYKEPLDVDIISFKKWPIGVTLPSSCEEFLSFVEGADNISRRSKTILVSCYDGKTASGVYVSLCFVIEKIKLEQECDVCLAVRTVRRNRKQFVSEESQFIFLYETALRYINGFQLYANFQKQ